MWFDRALNQYLRRGGLLAYPTESCFGLGCDPRHTGALKRLLRLKRRPWHKGLIVVAADLAQVRPLLRPLSPAATAAATRYWPGPYSLLLPCRAGVSPYLRGRHRQLAVRLSAFAPVPALCRHAGMALVSTSANRAGQRPLRTARECRRLFGHAVRVINRPIGGSKRPSTIIDPDSGQILR